MWWKNEIASGMSHFNKYSGVIHTHLYVQCEKTMK